MRKKITAALLAGAFALSVLYRRAARMRGTDSTIEQEGANAVDSAGVTSHKLQQSKLVNRKEVGMEDRIDRARERIELACGVEPLEPVTYGESVELQMTRAIIELAAIMEASSTREPLDSVVPEQRAQRRHTLARKLGPWS
jgi:hypothetical protein